MLKVRGNAKINLTLDVLYKREDGFHQVEMIMQAIELADILHLEERENGNISVKSNISRLPCDHRNLAYRAAALIKETCQVNKGVHIHLEKNIPVAAGLAGGSTDAASVLTGLNKLWKLGLSVSELEILGAKLGSDVPFCLRGGTMLATGRGELLKPLTDLKPCYVVLAKPPIGVSTAWVYRQYRGQDVKDHPDTDGVVACLNQGDLTGVANRLQNVLETVTIKEHPEIKELKKTMMQYGAMASLMSGSGPTVFGLVEEQAGAEYLAAKIRSQRSAEVFVTKIVGKNGGV
ncbi:4-(cytidine 5'-diphospho)-2-C-methyl-D-erythritol kinase [Pelosinus sp. UFO1]|uniref:4-(cytidine 5'-diphospho)-2-C-methyl-D-erythritol kinase n=1 Tax=Pelosinus sp. UFO1 TaxID=484770 RepID=UPI0004D1F2E9|nr:4-(cytidine 5'-diphospho)-2-C-methyl-D-erythritol kinase [Pelosinus sp. UFO1]AIF53847.1 4-diphosphocytidyl-2-C-methyl-D-erythritol kinase [Pelosinus sp. UFO1]